MVFAMHITISKSSYTNCGVIHSDSTNIINYSVIQSFYLYIHVKTDPLVLSERSVFSVCVFCKCKISRISRFRAHAANCELLFEG